MDMESALVVAIVAAALLGLGLRATGPLRLVAAACAALAAAGFALWQPGGDSALRAALPGASDDDGFATSSACRACHPGAYDAWHRSFHRTMTQVATPETVLADFDDVVLEDRGRSARLERRGDAFFAAIPDPLWYQDPSPTRPPAPPQIEVRVVMTTGSHHLQNYWARRPASGKVHADSYDNGALVQIPWVWVIDDARWVAGQDSFLTPPSPHPEPPLVWNTSCHLCHSVAPSPGFSGERFDTKSVELGIACEACHGPADEHVRRHRSPWRRYLAHLGLAGDDAAIVNPERLPKVRAAEVCGQCHSFSSVVDVARWQKSGVPYRPGDVLDESKHVLLYEPEPSDPFLLAHLEREPDALVGRYWADGTIRVAGREYNGMLETACFQRGDMTCLSCHSMHDYVEPSDQLDRQLDGDAACLECHASYADAPEAHTHHPPDSEASRCVSCHMPHTTWGLFVAMRAHRIDSPSVATSARTGRPNACNLCHLDQTLGWTDARMTEWYGHAPAALDVEQRDLAAGVLWSVSGDAAQRAITAWHMGWGPAQLAAGTDWMGAYLASLLVDPYAAVRHVAGGSIRSLPGFDDFEYDYVAPEDARRRSYEAASRRWLDGASGAIRPDRARLLLSDEGVVQADAFEVLYLRRDETPLRIIE